MNKHLLKEVNELYPEKSNKLVDFIFFKMNKKKSIGRQLGETLLQSKALTTLFVKHKYVMMAFYDDDIMFIYNPNTKDRFKEIYKYDNLNDIEFNIEKVKTLLGSSFVIKWIFNNDEYSSRFGSIKNDTTFGKKSNRVGVKIQEIFNQILDKN